MENTNNELETNLSSDLHQDIVQESDIADDLCDNAECVHKSKTRSGEEQRSLVNRLRRIEGQVRGIKRMIEQNAYCIDVLVQVAAVNAALNSFSRVLLSEHIRTCVTQDIKDGKEETIEELLATLQKLMK